MSKVKILSIAVVGLLLLNVSVLVFMFLNKPPHPKGNFPPERIEEGPKNLIIEKLHLDAQQITEYEKLIDQHQTKIKLLDKELKDTKNNLYQQLNNNGTILKDSLMNQLSNIQRKIEDLHYQHFEEIKKICKEDQLKYFNELTKELAQFFKPNKEGRNQQPPPNPNE